MLKLLSLFTSLTASALQPGTPLPANLKAKNQNGQVIEFSSLKGKNILIYFYPKDDTPGCTKQACSLRDNFSRFKDSNTVIFGVSRQDEKSHKDFIAKHKLPFDLLVDTDGSLAKALGVETMPVVGFAKRQSLVIGPDGKVIQFFESVDPITHTDEVLKALKK